MTRDEVLAALSRAEVDYTKVKVGSQVVVDYSDAKWKAKALRAAAELIRQGGWRPIAECGDAYLKHVGKWSGDTWKEDWNVWPEWAKANGYTHFFTEPEPPAREVENG